MKTPETDNRVVDYLYDDLPEAERQEFEEHLAADAEAAAQAETLATLLKLYRTETEELTPSVAATEALLREAERAQRSLWARLFGDLIPRVVLRPAVGFAMVAVLLIGGGVFYVLSQGSMGSKGAETEGPRKASAVDRGERTVAAAPAPSGAPARTSTEVAEKDQNGVAGKDLPADDKTVDGRFGASNKRLSTITTRGYFKQGKKGALGVLSERETAKRDDGLRRRARRGRAPAKLRSVARGGAVTGNAEPPAYSTRLAKKPAAAPPPQAAADEDRSPKRSKPKAKVAQRAVQKKTLSPPALHNRARKNLAKGQVAVACRMFSSLVRGHRSYARRADALLGWARCEMTRGSYARARQLAYQLIREYPKWKKTGQTLLARIRTQQAQSAYRAQRSRRYKRVRARRRPARRAAPRARPRPTSSD